MEDQTDFLQLDDPREHVVHTPVTITATSAAVVLPPVEEFRGIENFVGDNPDQTVSTLKASLERFTCDELSEFHTVAVRMNSWITWLFDKSLTLQKCKPADFVPKFQAWRTKLDYYLYTEPSSLAPFTDDRPAFLREDDRKTVVRLFEGRQRELKRLLDQHKITRIEAARGTSFVAGVVEISKKLPVATSNSSEHGKLAAIEPGEGGYRQGSRILAPSLGRRFEYKP